LPFPHSPRFSRFPPPPFHSPCHQSRFSRPLPLSLPHCFKPPPQSNFFLFPGDSIGYRFLWFHRTPPSSFNPQISAPIFFPGGEFLTYHGIRLMLFSTPPGLSHSQGTKCPLLNFPQNVRDFFTQSSHTSTTKFFSPRHQLPPRTPWARGFPFTGIEGRIGRLPFFQVLLSRICYKLSPCFTFCDLVVSLLSFFSVLVPE